MIKSFSITRFMLTLLVACAICPLAPAQAVGFSGLSSWIDDNLIDPEDGMLNASDYMESSYGFIPVPIIITEPAVGFGLGAAVAYFHPDEPLDSEVHPHAGPPSISVGFGAVTDNETYLYGGAHLGVWKEDHIRYLGALAGASVNLKFYPGDREGGSTDEGIRFNIDGTFLYQQVQFRLKESNWWLGAAYLYINAENTFRVEGDPPDGLPDPQFEFNQGGLGVFVEYDGRNTAFTPSDGLRAQLEYRNYDSAWGSDFDYDHVLANVYHYTPFGAYSSLGLRFQGETVSGDVPFFAFPFVNLRGIPALRYQGETVFTAEAEWLWGFTPRWSLVLFGGVGDTSSVDVFSSEGDTVGAGCRVQGAGCRVQGAG